MIRKNGSRGSTGYKYEQFTYLPKLSFYTNSSDMKELGDMPNKEEKEDENNSI